jgi:hypothetical protein
MKKFFSRNTDWVISRIKLINVGVIKQVIGSLLGQILPIMFGVYLGFAMNNYGERLRLNNQADVYRSMLVNEIKENHQAIISVHDYHKKLVADFDTLLTQESIAESFRSSNFRGFRPGFVSSSAYDTGVQTGIIQELGLELVQTLNRLYTLQGKYNRFNENMVSSFLSNTYPETNAEVRGVIASASMSMNDVVYFEQELVSYYEQLLDREMILSGRE